MSGTAFPGWYVTFQTAVLQQLPRPDVLDQTTAERWIGNQSVLKERLAEVLLLGRSADLLLKFSGSVTVPATTLRFVVHQKFVVNIRRNASVKIRFLSNDFLSSFSGVIDEPMTKHALRYAKLLKPSNDRPIIAGLGGEAKAETTLSEMFSVMKVQKNGEFGALLNNSGANIFFIKDIGGVLRAVRVYWSDDGWDVDAIDVDNPGVWRDGTRVFFR